VLADPQTMIALSPGKPLLLYIANIRQSVGALLAQKDEHGNERPVYYISRLIRGPESRYSTAKKICLSLVFVVQKFRHYFLGHEVHLVSKSSPIKYPLTRPLLSRRTTK
jgi:hypothetical protein